MPEYVAVNLSSIKVGKPLLRAAYDSHGTLLLSQGHVITSQVQLQKLLERGLFQVASPHAGERPSGDLASTQASDRVNPFAEYGDLPDLLEVALRHFANAQADAAARIRALADSIDRMCVADGDASLALVHIYALAPSAYEQTVFLAILGNLLGRELQMPESDRLALVAALLTANIALLPYQDKLNQLPAALRPEQRVVVNRHPELGAAALRAAGVDDPLWLHIVAQHHESHDGAGYPHGLREDDIGREARVVALLERYVATITPRAYRARLTPAAAMVHLSTYNKSRRDHPLIDALLSVLSEYPPGSFVRMINDEVAIVTHRPPQGAGAFALRAVVSARGAPYTGSFARDATEPAHHPREAVDPILLPSVNLPSLWNYT